MNKPIYISSLNGLRGLAAIMVAISHALVVYSVDGIPDIWKYPWGNLHGTTSIVTKCILILMNGSAAVFIFFVLSGILMQRSFEGKQITLNVYLQFILKRVVRLYPVYGFVVCITLIYLTYFHSSIIPDVTSEWYHMWFRQRITVKESIQNFLLVDPSYSGVAWTLKIELMASFFMPMFILIFRSRTILQNIFILILLYLWSFFPLHHLNTGFFYVFYIALFSHQFQSNISSRSTKWILPLSISLLLLPQSLPIEDHIKSLIQTMGAFGLINTFIVLPYKWLDDRVLQWIGTISYPFYLLHFLVLYSLTEYFGIYLLQVYGMHGLGLNMVMMVVSILLTLPLANILHLFIEKHTIKRLRIRLT